MIKITKVLILLCIITILFSGFISCSSNHPANSLEEAPITQNPKESNRTELPEEDPTENNINLPIEEQDPSEDKTSKTQPNTEINDLEALNNEKYGWGLVPTTDGSTPSIPENWKDLLQKYSGYYLGDVSRKEVYLTFDEGYEGGYTAKILDILKENNIKTSFFITGYYLDKNKDLVQRMLDEGHIIGNHSVNHPSFPSLSTEKMKSEIEELSYKYNQIFGRNFDYFRPPMGEFSEKSIALTNSLGYKTIFWSIALRDWEPLPGGSEESYNTVISRLHNGAIILLHAVSEDDTIALPRIINTIREKGFEFKTLDELP